MRTTFLVIIAALAAGHTARADCLLQSSREQRESPFRCSGRCQVVVWLNDVEDTVVLTSGNHSVPARVRDLQGGPTDLKLLEALEPLRPGTVYEVEGSPSGFILPSEAPAEAAAPTIVRLDVTEAASRHHPQECRDSGLPIPSQPDSVTHRWLTIKATVTDASADDASLDLWLLHADAPLPSVSEDSFELPSPAPLAERVGRRDSDTSLRIDSHLLHDTRQFQHGDRIRVAARVVRNDGMASGIVLSDEITFGTAPWAACSAARADQVIGWTALLGWLLRRASRRRR